MWWLILIFVPQKAKKAKVNTPPSLNILFVSSWYPSKLDATLGNFIERHAQALISEGHQVVVMHEISSHRIWFPAVEFDQQSGISVFHLFIPKLFRRWKLLRMMLAKKAMQKILADHFEPDIVHGHVLHPVGPLAVEVAKYVNRPLVFTEHWSGFQAANAHKLTSKMLRETQYTLRKCSRVMPVSEDLKRSMKSIGLEADYEVVYNVVDTALFNTHNTKRSGIFSFLHISNFIPELKNTEGIIDAFAALKKDLKDDQPVELVIAGDGDINRLKSYVKENHPQLDAVRFIGTLNYEEVARLMKRASCFVLFSNLENLPCVVAEAHCCGIPVIATNVGGLPEMVNSNNGLLVPPEDVTDLTNAMQKVRQNFSAFSGEAIAEEAGKNYSYPVIAGQFMKVYRESLGNHQSA